MVLVFTRITAFLFSFILLFISHGNVQAEQIMTNLEKLDRPEISGAMFYPRQTGRTEPPAGAVNIDIPVADDVIIGSRLYPADKENPTILYFHGNGEIVPDHDDIGPIYAKLGINFLVTDYRGYGWSTGSPSASSLINDGRNILEYAAGWLQENGYTGKLFVMGRSMGSAPAIDLAAQPETGLSGLIIESGFAETLPLARTLGINLEALGISEKDTFNNTAKIGRVTIPTFILHGQQDSLIPLWQAEKLHAACGARSKELQIIPGGDHNTLIAVAGMLYFEAIKRYIDTITGASSWRARRKRFKE